MGKTTQVAWALCATGWEEEGVSEAVREEMTSKLGKNSSTQKDVKSSPAGGHSTSKDMGREMTGLR